MLFDKQMRYIEQLRYSWSYHRGVFCDCLEMLTGKFRWWMLGLFFVLVAIPSVAAFFIPHAVRYYATTPVPQFDPSLSQDIITDYYWIVREKPPFLLVLNYFWVRGDNFRPLALVLGVATVGVLLGGDFRDIARDREG